MYNVNQTFLVVANPQAASKQCRFWTINGYIYAKSTVMDLTAIKQQLIAEIQASNDENLLMKLLDIVKQHQASTGQRQDLREGTRKTEQGKAPYWNAKEEIAKLKRESMNYKAQIPGRAGLESNKAILRYEQQNKGFADNLYNFLSELLDSID